MNRSGDPRSSRRQWCLTAARGLALGGIAWLTADLLARPAGPTRDGCRRDVPCCRDCVALSECRLPEALAARKQVSCSKVAGTGHHVPVVPGACYFR